MSNHESLEATPQEVLIDFLFEGKQRERRAFERDGYAVLQDILQPSDETDLEDFAASTKA